MSDAGALAGLRVIELAGQGPVPFAAALLADHGAAVTRVRAPQRGPLAGLVGSPEPMAAGRAEELVLDLKSPTDRAVMLERVTGADVLVEGYRPGVAERLGIGPDECASVNPRLVYVRVSGWGQTGPLRLRAGHDINYLARSGALAAIGPADRPVPPLNLVADYAAGSMFALFGLLAALYERDRSGVGQVIDAGLVDAVSYLMSPFYELWQNDSWSMNRASNVLDGGAPFYDVYETSDGYHMAVGALEAPFFTALCRAVGVADDPAFADQWDRDRWPEMRAVLTERFVSKTRGEWVEIAGDDDTCSDPVLTIAELAGNPGVGSHVSTGRGGVVPVVAPRLSRTPGRRVSAGAPEPARSTTC